LTSKRAKKLGERERTVGLDPEDEATRWLDEHDPPPKHQWRQRQQRGK